VVAKTLLEEKIAGRAERRRLAARTAPYWRGIDPDVHLGYRKGIRGGVWLVRWRAGDGYRQQKIGTADDELRVGTLDFEEAVRSARVIVEEGRRAAKSAEAGPVVTVGVAVENYARMRDARHIARMGRIGRSDATYRLERYISGRAASGNRKAIEPSPLRDVPLHALSERDLEKWRSALPVKLKGTTQRRLVNDLRAALNDGYMAQRRHLPSTVPEVIKYGLRTAGLTDYDDEIARENQILTDAQIRDVIGAARMVDDKQEWDGDLYRMIILLAATGARFSQIARMRVADVQEDALRLMVPVSQKGTGERKGRVPVPVGPDVLNALKPILDQRPVSDVLLQRWRSKQVPGSIRWVRDQRGPWQNAAELVRPWKEVRALVGLPDLVPYALRHSSVVRGIRANLPIRLVAEIHNTSVAMIERHYGRYVASGLDALVARAVVPLVSTT
jgi:integrase